MKRFVSMILLLCLLLGGCSAWLDGSYVSVKPHEEQDSQTDEQIISVSSYSSLHRALSSLVWDGAEGAVISVANYNQLTVSRDTRAAVQDIMTNDPIGAYAVEDILFELGTSAGKPAISVEVQYIHDGKEIQKIQKMQHMEEAGEAIAQALDNCDSGIALYVEQFEETDLAQWVEDYGSQNPDKVMEVPQVTVNVYPESGSDRVVELKFVYQNSRDSLRVMQAQVLEVVDAAVDRAAAEAPENLFAGMYTQLNGLTQSSQQGTSLTPAYSLLIHGVGDAKAFAAVYAAMCRRVGLECIVVAGTRSGEPWSWNIICRDGVYYHVDLLRCRENGAFSGRTDKEMTEYIWDYSAYPACGTEAERQ